jgi:hypothetical protein
MKHFNTLQSLVLIGSLVAGTVINIQPTQAFEAERAGELAEFNDASGIRLKYPRDWSVKRKPDKDTLAKFSGKPAPNVEAEITVSLIDDGGLKLEDFARMFGDLMFAKLSGVRRSSLQTMFVGASGRLSGRMQTVSFTMHGMPVYQEYLFVPARNKMLVVALTTQNWQRSAVEGAWKSFINSIDAPEDMISHASMSEVTALKTQTIPAVCNTYSASCVIKRPTKSMTLDQKINAVLPRTEEERFLQIPWQTDLLSARLQSERIGKPMFIWIMDGNVLGAT